MSYVNEFASNFGGNGVYPVDEEKDRSVEAEIPENPNSDIKRGLRRLMHVAVKNEQNDLLDILNRTYAEIVDLEEEELTLTKDEGILEAVDRSLRSLQL